VQNYLMDQSVMTFGGSATRSSAIGTANFEEGMVSYLTDTDKLEVYNGTNWVSVAPTTSTPMGVLINSTSFSGVSAQSLNNVFTSTYDNYRIIMPITGLVADATITARLRVSGADNSNNAYTTVLVSGNGAAASSTSTSTTSFDLSSVDGPTSAFRYVISFDIFRPQKVDRTLFIGTVGTFTSAGASVVSSIWGSQENSTSFDGLTILSSANITGTIQVFGYNQ
jgi:hypothetical protein